MVKNKKLLKESGNLNRTPQESVKVASKAMSTSTDGTPISKKIGKIVDDILAGKTKSYHNSSLAKDKKLAENANLRKNDLLASEAEDNFTEAEECEEKDMKETLDDMNTEDEYEDFSGQFEMEANDDLDISALDDIKFEDEEGEEIDVDIDDERAGDYEVDEDEFPDFSPELTEKEKSKKDDEEEEVEPEEEIDLKISDDDDEEEEEEPDPEPEIDSDEDMEEMEGNFSVNIPESEDDELDPDLKDKADEFETEAEEIKEKVANMMEKIDESIMDANLKESIVIMFEMYANAKAKAIATRKTNTILSNVDNYMTTMVEKFVKVNGKKINESINTSKKLALYEKMQHAIEKIYGQDVLTESYKTENILTNVIALQKKEMAKMERKLNEAKLANEQLQSKIIFIEETKNLSELDKKRLAIIMENYGHFNNVSDFKKKLNIVLENFSVSSKKQAVKKTPEKFSQLTEEKIQRAISKKETLTESEKVDASKYAQFLP